MLTKLLEPEELTLAHDQGNLEVFRKELDKAIASYQSPHERRVGYGNLRHEYSTWKNQGEELTNVAIIYETPGGSTTQINITYNHHDGVFSHLDSDLGDNIDTQDPHDVLHVVEHHVRGIPEKRRDQLNSQVDAWMTEGKSKREVFAELNKLLQEQFLGGRITTQELKAGIQHAIKLKAEVDG